MNTFSISGASGIIGSSGTSDGLSEVILDFLGLTSNFLTSTLNPGANSYIYSNMREILASSISCFAALLVIVGALSGSTGLDLTLVLVLFPPILGSDLGSDLVDIFYPINRIESSSSSISSILILFLEYIFGFLSS